VTDAARAQLDALVAGLRESLGAGLLAVYLHGSAALGCFNPRLSDLDVLVVARGRLSDDRRTSVVALLERASPPRGDRPLELHVLVAGEVSPWRHPAPFELHWGSRGAVPRGTDPDLAAHLTVARAAGIALVGPPPEELLPEVPWEDYADALRRDLAWTRDHAPDLYAILGPLRIWATLETGQLHSKASAAEWALPRLPPDVRTLVERAAAHYRGEGADIELEPAERERLLDLVGEQIA
jgi:Domain of unknown function (DUF4111)